MATDSGRPASVDPDEVAYYRCMADLWWDGQGPFWPLHTLNRLRVEYIRAFLCRRLSLSGSAPTLAGLKVLDIGCGGGILSESMAVLDADVQGVDVVDRNIQVARLHAESSGLSIDYRLGTAEALAESGEAFDVVLNMEVVEHVADLPGFMAACCRLVRPGGVMFVATINRTLASLLAAKIGAEYVLRWLPRGTHQWRRFRKPSEIEALLKENGLAMEAITGVRVNPLSRRMSLTSYLGVNYMLAAGKPGS